MTTSRIPQIHSNQTKFDSIIITEIIRDTVVKLRADSSIIQMLLLVDSLGRIQMGNLLGYTPGEKLKPPNITIRDNVLTATAHADSLDIYLQLKDRYEKQITTHTTQSTKIVEVNKLTWWQVLWNTVGKAGSGLAFIYMLFRIIKLKLKT